MKKFVKVLDGEMSNAGGFKYKINEVNEAMNWNPKADEAKAMGGFSFSSEDKIFRWLLRGNTIYDVEIPIDADVLEIESINAPHGVFRTNKIILSNPRKLDENMIMDLYLKSDLPLNSYFQCLTFLALDGYLEVCRRIIVDKVNDLNVKEVYKTFSTFFDLKEEDKNDSYIEVENMLKEIMEKDLINVAISRDPLEVKLTDDPVINISGQSGSGKTTYIREHYDNKVYLIVDTDDIFSDKRFEKAAGINRELGEMFREKYDVLPDLGENFDLIYNDILDYCHLLNKIVIIDCAQFHCVKDMSVLKGQVVIIRTNISTCYDRCIKRFIANNKDYTEEELAAYKEKKKKIFKWYKQTNCFIKKLLK
ncbi:MAG: hypothetical protein II625_08855 [Bacilli bacterium]|nr:hypothetical protein [Bacilli bacterium]